jgi:putative transposase
MDERLRFVARLLDGEKMAVLCREFEISRKTGYKIFGRYKDCGVDGLTDRSRRPYRHARQLPFQIEAAILQLKREHPSWGAPKIRERLRRKHSEVQCPAISTVHAILDRNGLVRRRQRRLRRDGHRADVLHDHRVSRPGHVAKAVLGPQRSSRLSVQAGALLRFPCSNSLFAGFPITYRSLVRKLNRRKSFRGTSVSENRDCVVPKTL